MQHDTGTDMTTQPKPGEAPEYPIEVQSIGEEYRWLRENLPGHRILSQALMEASGRKLDRLNIQAADGRLKSLFFLLSEGGLVKSTRTPPSHYQTQPCLECGWATLIQTDEGLRCKTCGARQQ